MHKMGEVIENKKDKRPACPSPMYLLELPNELHMLVDPPNTYLLDPRD
jgi:hypothetical protein